jgi:hypothetical protein
MTETNGFHNNDFQKRNLNNGKEIDFLQKKDQSISEEEKLNNEKNPSLPREPDTASTGEQSIPADGEEREKATNENSQTNEVKEIKRLPKDVLAGVVSTIIQIGITILSIVISKAICGPLSFPIQFETLIVLSCVYIFILEKIYRLPINKWFIFINGCFTGALIITLGIFWLLSSRGGSIAVNCSNTVSSISIQKTIICTTSPAEDGTAPATPPATGVPVIDNTFKDFFNKSIWDISALDFSGTTYSNFPDYYDYSAYGFNTIRDIDKIKENQIFIHKQLTIVNNASSFVSRLNDQDEYYKITISDLSLDYADPCPDKGYCDVQLVIGLDNEIIRNPPFHTVKPFNQSEPGFGKYVVFRAFRDLSTGERMRVICMPVNIYDSCKYPIKYNGVNHLSANEFEGPWTVIIDKSGSLVSFQLLDKNEDIIADTGNLTIDKNAYLWVGYYIKNKGEVSAYLEGPTQ